MRKILDAPKPCLSDEHEPPKHIVLDPGRYEHICPTCGQITVFDVPLITN